MVNGTWKKREELLQLIENDFINQDGLLSGEYPPSNINLLADFDDYIPFMLYYGKENYCKSQIFNSPKHLYKFLVPNTNNILSYRTDEWIGGLLAYYKHSKDKKVIDILKKSLDEIDNLLEKNGFICSSYNIEKKTQSHFATPRSGNLLEVMLEVGEIFPEVRYKTMNYIDKWLENPFFCKYGLFPSHYYIFTSSPILNRSFNEVLEKLDNLLTTLANKFTSKNVYYISKMQVKLMKENSSLIFSLISAYKITENPKYKVAIEKWIKSVKKSLYVDGFISMYWERYNDNPKIQLSQNFTIIDIICDFYFFVNKDKKYLHFAEKIAESWINIRFDNGLFPRGPGIDYDDLDEQTDMCVSLHRLYELTSKTKYKKIADDTFNSILKYHYSNKGYVLNVNKQGEQTNKKIVPKYNALLLKAFIISTDSVEIYKNTLIHDLMKDR